MFEGKTLEEVKQLDEQHRAALKAYLETYSWQSLALHGFFVEAVHRVYKERHAQDSKFGLVAARDAVDSFIASNA